MPIVLATAEGKESSGYAYDDKTGISYEYPSIYSKLVTSGEPFVYSIKGGNGYAGAGLIGQIHPSTKPGLWVCAIEHYVPFEAPVPLKAVDGYYYEARPEEGKLDVYWARGVRPISPSRFEKLIAAAAVNHLAISSPGHAPGNGYASKAVAEEVERISVSVAMKWLQNVYPGEVVIEMPRNNPGFDIRVGPASEPLLHVEVKGTQSAEPEFWMSEGERLHSIQHEDHYLLIVVSGIDLKGTHQHQIWTHSGRVEAPAFSLSPSQWKGKLLS